MSHAMTRQEPARRVDPRPRSVFQPRPNLGWVTLTCSLLISAGGTLADPLESPIYFQKTLTQNEVLIDIPMSSDNQATARWNSDGSISSWHCGSEVFANSQRHDALYEATVFPGQSNLAPTVAVHSAGDNAAKHDRWHANNVCSPSVVDVPSVSGPDSTYLYFECSPIVYDLDVPGNTPGMGNPSPPFGGSFNQVCLARQTSQGWELYSQEVSGLWGDQETTRPTPVVRVRQEAIEDADLADDNETQPGTFVPPIDGHLYGDSDTLLLSRHVGVSHPVALYNPDGSGELWLYYWDAWIHKMSLVKSIDGYTFGASIATNINHPSYIKYFPDLEIDGQQGVWIGTALFKGRRWFEYSLDGVSFVGTDPVNPADPTDPTYPQEEFALAIAETSHHCPAPGAGSFVGDTYGHVQGVRKFGFLSGEGFRRSSEIPPGMDFCHHPLEDQVRGQTWGIYYLEGDFTDVEVANESCELEGDPALANGRISQGTLVPDWTVGDPQRGGRNRVVRSDSGASFEMAFFNNGIPMDGRDVCFLKQSTSMSQALEGFTPGRAYRVRAWVNARTSGVPGGFPTPTLRIELGGQVLEAGVSVPAVDVKNGFSNDFREVVTAVSFTPTDAGPFDLVLRQTAPGDATLLVDRVIVEAVPPALTVANPSCEDGAIGEPYGLLDHGTTMPGWTGSDPQRVGRNTAGMVFYNNGATVDGSAVCLLKQQSSISQQVPGFEQGKTYRVKVWANARTALLQGHYPTPVLRIELGGQVLEPGVAAPAVDPKDVYQTPFQELVASHLFVATASEPQELVLTQTAAGDPTLLIDRVVIEEVP